MDRVEVVEVVFPDGEIGHVEVAVAARGDVRTRKQRYSLEEIGPEIRRITRWIVGEVQDAMPGKPQKVGLEFGLKLSAETGKLIGALAKVGGEAAVVIKLEWAPNGEK